MMKILKYLIVVSLLLITAPINSYASALVSIDHVEGINEDGSLVTGDTVKFYFRFQLDYDNPKSIKFRNNFKIFSPDGAQWNSTKIKDEMLFNSNYINFVSLFNRDYASNQENIITKFNIKKQFIDSLAPTSFDNVTFSISLVIPDEFKGKTICIDINSDYKNNLWNWNISPKNNNIIPEWNGPVCFLIGGNCCFDKRGNTDNSLDGFVDILDLTLLIEYLYYFGDAPICATEADLNNDQVVTLSDIMLLSDYIFGAGLVSIPDCLITD